MIADPLWSCVMLLCGSFAVICSHLRYLVIPSPEEEMEGNGWGRFPEKEGFEVYFHILWSVGQYSRSSSYILIEQGNFHVAKVFANHEVSLLAIC